MSFEQGLLLITISIGVGWFALPALWLSSRIRSRQRDIGVNLADTLDLLVICLEAGLSFDAALMKVAKEQRRRSRVLSEELLYTEKEISVGKQRRDALHSLALRCGNQSDVRSLIAVIIHAEKFGSSISQSLRVQAESLRFRRTQNMKEILSKLPVKLVFPLVFFFLPALFLILVGPAVLHLTNTISRIAG